MSRKGTMRLHGSLVILLSCALLAGCATQRTAHRPPLDPQPLLRLETPDHEATRRARLATQNQVKAFYEALQAAEAAPTDATALGEYLESGIGLVNSFCRGWFAQLDDYSRNLARSKSHHGILNALGTALIGVGDLHPDVTAVYGALNTALSGAIDSAARNYLFSASAVTVENKVFSHLNARAKRLRETRFDSLHQVRNELEDYDRICTHKHAEALVQKSVEETRSEVGDDGSILKLSFDDDPSSVAFRFFWKPDGTAVDQGFQRFAEQWIASQGGSVSLTGFTYGTQYREARRQLLLDYTQSAGRNSP